MTTCSAHWPCIVAVLIIAFIGCGTRSLALPVSGGPDKLISDFYANGHQNPDSFELELGSLKREADSMGNFQVAKDAGIAWGIASHSLGKSETTIFRLNQVLTGGYVLSAVDSGRIYFHLRDSYLKLQAYEKALETHHIFQAFARAYLGESRYVLDDEVLGELYLTIGSYNKSIGIYRDLINRCKDQGHVRSKAVYVNNIGLCYDKMKEADSALNYFHKAETIIQRELLDKTFTLYDSFFLALVGGNRAEVLFKQKREYDLAVPLLEKALDYSLRIKNYTTAVATCNTLAELYLQLKQSDKSLVHANDAIQLARKLELTKPLVRSYKLKGLAFKRLGQLDSATVHFENAVMLDELITEKDDERKALALQAAYEVDMKDEELRKHLALNRINSKELEKRKNQAGLFRIVLAFTILSLILVYVAYYQKRQRERHLALVNHEVALQKRIIENSLAEKEALLKEIHHRVKNNLQVISSLLELQAQRSTDEELKRAIVEGQHRVKSMALIHQKLYQTNNFSTLPFRNYIEDLMQTLLITYGGGGEQPKIKLDCDGVSFNMDVAIPLGLIINELVSNTLKYAFKSSEKAEIQIMLKEQQTGEFILKVVDNGVGLPDDFDIENSDSLGVRLVKTLVRQLDGESQLYTDHGTIFTLQFTLENPNSFKHHESQGENLTS